MWAIASPLVLPALAMLLTMPALLAPPSVGVPANNTMGGVNFSHHHQQHDPYLVWVDVAGINNSFLGLAISKDRSVNSFLPLFVTERGSKVDLLVLGCTWPTTWDPSSRSKLTNPDFVVFALVLDKTALGTCSNMFVVDEFTPIGLLSEAT